MAKHLEHYPSNHISRGAITLASTISFDHCQDVFIRAIQFLTFMVVLTTGFMASSAPLPLESEVMEYDIKWGAVTAGKATMSCRRYSEGGTNVWIRVMQAKSQGWVSLFKRIDSQIVSLERINEVGETMYEVHKLIREGSFRQDDFLTVDSVRKVASWSDRRAKTNVEFMIPEGTQDYVSMMFSLRSLGDLPRDEPRLYALIMDDAVHEMSAEVVDTAHVKSALGDHEARELLVKSKSPGLFVRNIPESIWVCPEQRIIVSMDISTRLGRVKTLLTRWTVDGVDITRSDRSLKSM